MGRRHGRPEGQKDDLRGARTALVVGASTQVGFGRADRRAPPAWRRPSLLASLSAVASRPVPEPAAPGEADGAEGMEEEAVEESGDEGSGEESGDEDEVGASARDGVDDEGGRSASGSDGESGWDDEGPGRPTRGPGEASTSAAADRDVARAALPASATQRVGRRAAGRDGGRPPTPGPLLAEEGAPGRDGDAAGPTTEQAAEPPAGVPYEEAVASETPTLHPTQSWWERVVLRRPAGEPLVGTERPLSQRVHESAPYEPQHMVFSNDHFIREYQDAITGENVWYYRDRMSVPRGPCTLPALRQAWSAGLIDETTLVWGQGLLEWIPMRNVGMLCENVNIPEVRLATWIKRKIAIEPALRAKARRDAELDARSEAQRQEDEARAAHRSRAELYPTSPTSLARQREDWGFVRSYYDTQNSQYLDWED